MKYNYNIYGHVIWA